MITRKDVLEIKGLHTQDRCPYTHVAACYVVDNRITCIVPPKEMLNLPDEEFFKYLDIAKEIFQPKSIGEKNLCKGLAMKCRGINIWTMMLQKMHHRIFLRRTQSDIR